MPADFALTDFAAVIFDWDGVLVDSGRNYYRAYEMVLREIGMVTTPREIYLREGQPTPEVISAMCAERGISISPSQIRELVHRRREYDAALGPREFFAGVWNLIDDLRAQGYKVGVVTGSSRQSVELLLTPSLDMRLDAVVTADDVQHGKPDPEPFLKAAELMKVPASKSLVVENAPFGIESARAAGCKVVALCTTLPAGDLQGANWIVRDHEEMQSLFASKKSVRV